MPGSGPDARRRADDGSPTVRVVAVGEAGVLAGFPLVGVRLLAAESPAEVRAAWAGLPDGTGVVLLTQRSAAVLTREREDLRSPMTVVVP